MPFYGTKYRRLRIKKRRPLRRPVKRSGAKYAPKRTIGRMNPGLSYKPSNWLQGAGGKVQKLCPDTGKVTWPDTQYVDLKWTNFFNPANTGAGLCGSDGTIYLNDLAYPCDAAWRLQPSHDPRGVVQWSAMYRRYRVEKATVRIECLQAHNASNVLLMNVQTADDTFAYSGLTVLEGEQDGAISVLGSQCMNGQGANPVYENTFDIAQVEGINRVQFLAGNYEAAFGFSPNLRTKLRFAVGDYAGNGTGELHFQATIIYHVCLFDRKDPARS